MFNDDPYGRQRQKNQVAVGVAPVVAKPAGLTRGVPAGLNVPPPLNPVQIPQNDVVAPKLRRDAATFAPITNHFSPDAAARQLVDQRLAASGQPMPSDMTPFAQRAPRPGDAGLIARANQAPAAPAAQPVAASIQQPPGLNITRAASAFAQAPQPLPQAPPEKAGMVHPVPEGFNTAAKPGERFVSGYGGPPSTADNPRFQTPAVQPGAQPPAAVPPPAPKLTRLQSDKEIWDTRAKGRMVNGVETFDSQWAADPNNARRLELYAGQGNAVASVVPAPGVAASTVTGGNMPEGSLTRAPRGFTAEDRARQSEAITERGNAFRTGEAADYARTRGRMALASGDLQRAEAIGNQATIESGMQVAPPITTSQAMATQRLAGQKQAVEQGNDAAKLAMDQEAQAVLNEQNKAQTETQQMQLANAKQMDQLRQQIINGTPEQSQAAIKTMTALSGPSKTGFIKVQVPVPTGIGPQGEQMYGNGEILINEATGQIAFDPRVQGNDMPTDDDIAALRKNPTPENLAFFKQAYPGVDPARYVN